MRICLGILVLVWNIMEEELRGTRKYYHVTWLQTRYGNTTWKAGRHRWRQRAGADGWTVQWRNGKRTSEVKLKITECYSWPFLFQSMSFEAHHLTVPSVKWLGLLPSDLKRWVISSEEKGSILLLHRQEMQSDLLHKNPFKSITLFMYYFGLI